MGVCSIRGQSSLTQRSIAACRARQHAASGAARSSPADGATAPTRARDDAHPGQRLDHGGDAVQGPQLTNEPVGGGALQQGLFGLGELDVGHLGSGPVGPRLRNASSPPARQRVCHTLTAWGRRRAGGRPRLGGHRWQQLAGAQPAGLQPVRFLLCRGVAGKGCHGRILPGQAGPAPTRSCALATRHPRPFSVRFRNYRDIGRGVRLPGRLRQECGGPAAAVLARRQREHVALARLRWSGGPGRRGRRGTSCPVVRTPDAAC
jgi:hypothetical protein